MRIPAKWAIYLGAGLVALSALVSFTLDGPFMLPAAEAVMEAFYVFSKWAHDAGAIGIVITILIFAIGVVVAFPSAIMTIAVTMLFGYWAAPIAWVGALIGLALAYYLARGFLRRHLVWLLALYPTARGIDRALQKRGSWIVLLMRQSPIIPFAAQNYLFGMLGISPAAYITASAIGIIPGTLAKVIIIAGAGGYGGGSGPQEQWLNAAFITVGIAATILVMVIIGRAVRRELREEGVS